METKPVVQSEVIFKEIRPCQNADYFMARFIFPQEAFGKIFKPEEQPNPVMTSILCEANKHNQVLSLKPDHKYQLLLGISVSKPNTKDGKNYPAALNFDIVNVKPI